MNFGPIPPGGSGQEYGPNDETVEFNKISFKNDGTIETVGAKGKEYDKNRVLMRTIVHEMGHAISNDMGHCCNSNGIMYGATLDWDMRFFGTASCNHRDMIKAGVYNKVH
jgi:hypothetical protein